MTDRKVVVSVQWTAEERHALLVVLREELEGLQELRRERKAPLLNGEGVRERELTRLIALTMSGIQGFLEENRGLFAPYIA